MPLCINHRQYIVNHTNGNQPYLIFTMIPIKKFQQSTILKNHRRYFKRNPMLPSIRLRFLFVPFKPQTTDVRRHIRHPITFLL